MRLRTMKSPGGNRDRWASSEFAEWSSGRGLSATEHALIDRYLSKDGDTLEAGTGGGRILYAMRDMGFTSLAGFDNVPDMVRSARSADPAGEIRFDVHEATDLGYATDSFDQVIYLQQLMSFIDSDDGRAAALREAHRVLRSSGVALISFLWWEPRQSHTIVRVVGPWLRALRLLRRTDRSARDWPWVRVGGRPNYGAILDHGPYIHWYTSREAQGLLEATGFSIVFSGGQTEVESISRIDSPVSQEVPGVSGVQLYFVCTKG